MIDKLEDLRRQYPDVPAIAKLCDALTASGDGVHGRAMELKRSDNKRASVTA